jgi:hypothetical protein
MAYSGDVMNLLADVNAQKSDDYFRGIGFDKGRQGASDYLAAQREAQGGLTLEEKQRYQTAANMKAIQPAVSSLEAGIPELKDAYTKRQEQLTAEKDPLVARYEQLLGEIRGRETSQINDVTKLTNREMARRGISADSGFAGNELQGRTQPIRSAAQSDILTTTFDRESKLREIDNAITNLTSEMVAAERDVRNSIAQIQATAGQQGVAQALQLFQIAQQERQAALDRALKERELTATIDNAKLTASTSAIKEVQGGLFNTLTNQWVVQPKKTGDGTTANVQKYLSAWLPTSSSSTSSGSSNSFGSGGNSQWYIIQ